jgi:hypothetical protein
MAFEKGDRFFRVIGDTNTGFNFEGQVLKYIGPSAHSGLEKISIVLHQPPFDVDGKECAIGGNMTIDRSKVEEVFRYYKLTPKSSSGMRFDVWLSKADAPWQDALALVEEQLEEQSMCSDEQIPWDGIGVNLECVWQTQEEIDNLDSDE